MKPTRSILFGILVTAAAFVGGNLCPPLFRPAGRAPVATAPATLVPLGEPSPSSREGGRHLANAAERIRELLARRERLQAEDREAKVTRQLLRERGWREDSPEWDRLLRRLERTAAELREVNDLLAEAPGRGQSGRNPGGADYPGGPLVQGHGWQSMKGSRDRCVLDASRRTFTEQLAWSGQWQRVAGQFLCKLLCNAGFRVGHRFQVAEDDARPGALDVGKQPMLEPACLAFDGATNTACFETYLAHLWFNSNGDLIGKHRKMRASVAERLCWGDGSGNLMSVFETEIGNLGGGLCWEHLVPLDLMALNSQNEQVHVASWPGYFDDEIPGRSYAMATQTFVLMTSSIYSQASSRPLPRCSRRCGVKPSPWLVRAGRRDPL